LELNLAKTLILCLILLIVSINLDNQGKIWKTGISSHAQSQSNLCCCTLSHLCYLQCRDIMKQIPKFAVADSQICSYRSPCLFLSFGDIFVYMPTLFDLSALVDCFILTSPMLILRAHNNNESYVHLLISVCQSYAVCAKYLN
jgi:hypothetical protein